MMRRKGASCIAGYAQITTGVARDALRPSVSCLFGAAEPTIDITRHPQWSLMRIMWPDHRPIVARSTPIVI
jgi:hypothetical protein